MKRALKAICLLCVIFPLLTTLRSYELEKRAGPDTLYRQLYLQISKDFQVAALPEWTGFGHRDGTMTLILIGYCWLLSLAACLGCVLPFLIDCAIALYRARQHRLKVEALAAMAVQVEDSTPVFTGTMYRDAGGYYVTPDGFEGALPAKIYISVEHATDFITSVLVPTPEYKPSFHGVGRKTDYTNEMSQRGSIMESCEQPPGCAKIHDAPPGTYDLSRYNYGVITRIKGFGKSPTGFTAAHVWRALASSPNNKVYVRVTTKDGTTKDIPMDLEQAIVASRSDSPNMDFVNFDMPAAFWASAEISAVPMSDRYLPNGRCVVYTPGPHSNNWTVARGALQKPKGLAYFEHNASTDPGSSGGPVLSGGRVVGMHLGSNNSINRGVRLDRIRRAVYPKTLLNEAAAAGIYTDGYQDTREDEWDENLEDAWRANTEEIWEDRILVGKEERRFISKATAYSEIVLKGRDWNEYTDEERESEIDLSEDEEDFFQHTNENASHRPKVTFNVVPSPTNVVEIMTQKAPKAKVKSKAPKSRPTAHPSKTDFRAGVRGAPESSQNKKTPSIHSAQNPRPSAEEHWTSECTGSVSTRRPPLRTSTLTSLPPMAISLASETGKTRTRRRTRRSKASRSKQPASSKAQNPPKKN
jgi:hypothetical protein